MKKYRILLILTLVFSLVILNAPVSAANDGSNHDFVSDRVLVKFRAGTDVAQQKQVNQALGVSVIGEIKALDVKVMKVPAGKVAEKVQALRNNPVIEFAEPDYIATAYITEIDDPSQTLQWGLAKIEAYEAWDFSTGDLGYVSKTPIKIAILDTGVDQNHEDLSEKIIASVNFTDSATSDDLYGHGTHCAGIAAAVTDNAKGVAGVGFESQILNGKVLDDSGSGAYSWIANGITWATDSGANVISLSLGGMFGSSLLLNAVNYAWAHGVVVVAAAGNDGRSIRNYPAYYTNCIAVAASDAADAKASFSNYGSWVDVGAPGVGIYSTIPNHTNTISTDYLKGQLNYGYLNGTSMATPFVAGLAGLVWATSYGADNAAVRSRIESTADPVGTLWSQYGIKRINAYDAVESDQTGPALSAIIAEPDSSSAVISWTTNEPADSTVNFGLTTAYGSTSSTPALVTAHSVSLTGLNTGTTYHYQVVSVDAAGNASASADYTFTTTAASGDLTPPVISSISVQTTKDTATVSWTTDDPTKSLLVYGLNTSYSTGSSTDSAYVTAHTMSLTGLAANRTYYYKITSTNGSDLSSTATGSFKTKKK